MFLKETDFKATSIGAVPKEWKVTSLGSVAEIRSNKGIKSAEKIAFIPMEAVSDSQIFAKYQIRRREDIKSYTYCEAGDLLLAKITPSLENGKQGIVPSDVPNNIALATTEVFPIHTTEVNALFLFYVLKFSRFRKKIISSMIGTTGRQRASKESVEKLEIPLPQPEEQQRITEVFSAVDSAIELADRVIAKTERLKKGLIQQLLTHGIGHTEYKNTPIGKTPKTWQISKLEEVSDDFIGGGTPSTQNQEYWNGDIAWMTSAHINGRLITTGQKYITKKGVESSATHIVPKNNLLVATRVGIGKAAINKIDIAISQDLTGVTINKEKALPEFLYWVLINSGNKLRSLAQGSTIKGILREDLGKLYIPRPSLAEQQKIDEILSTVDKKLELERTEKIELEKIKRGLMDLLLTGKIRVKVD